MFIPRLSAVPAVGRAGLLALSLIVSAGPVLAAATLDRAALAGQVCGSAATLGEAALGLVASATDAPPDDLGWGAGLTRALLDRRLACEGGRAILLNAPGGNAGQDPATGEAHVASPGARSPVLGLRQRALVETANAVYVLLTAARPEERSAALANVERRASTVPEAVLARAAAQETDVGLKGAIAAVGQAAALNSPDPAKRIAAIHSIAAVPSSVARARLLPLKEDPAYARDPDFRQALDAGVARADRAVTVGNVLAAVYNGLSVASILFMAAVGLAIIFGLMGVINLAQGEFITVGAYAAFGVQEAFKAFAPTLLDWYLIAAIPAAFAAAALVGMVLETVLLRHLYRRPLMSLLATWAVSLFLINFVRVLFGTRNLQFIMPSYVTGGFPLFGDFIVTANRLFAIVFAILTLGLTLLVMRRTALGLDIRAVTQNRDMAACLGIATRHVDRLSFGLGSGLAGLAGVALAPIYSVNPQMGSNFIIDSFMVVVLGGVGTLAGTVVAALGIGQVNVLIEPFYGAVAAKVIVLLAVILFIQWRPEGLFALKGRRR